MIDAAVGARKTVGDDRWGGVVRNVFREIEILLQRIGGGAGDGGVYRGAAGGDAEALGVVLAIARDRDEATAEPLRLPTERERVGGKFAFHRVEKGLAAEIDRSLLVGGRAKESAVAVQQPEVVLDLPRVGHRGDVSVDEIHARAKHIHGVDRIARPAAGCREADGREVKYAREILFGV